MKSQRLLLVCAAAFMLTGCLWEADDIMAHYLIGNETNRRIKIEAYSDDGASDIIWRYALVVEPNRVGETIIIGSMGSVHPPFSGATHLLLLDGKRTVMFRRDDFGNNHLFLLKCYDKLKYKRNQIWYKYTITEKDFENGIPVDAPLPEGSH